MKLIGFHYNYSAAAMRPGRLTPSLRNRIVLIDAELRQAGARLFVHGPHEIRPEDGKAPGVVLEAGEFCAVEAPVPKVVGNWTHRTRSLLSRGMGYQEFGRWAAANHVGIYVPHTLSELFGNKLETYTLVRSLHATLHPFCEPWAHTEEQLEHYVHTAHATFLKPVTGSQGDRIVTIRRDADGLLVTRYHEGERRQHRAASLRQVLGMLEDVERVKHKYIVQHGIETMRHRGSTFDIRVTMLNDGDGWHWLHEARLSPAGSDVSNVGQGGAITVTADLLTEMMGAEAAQELLHRLHGESFGLASHLERLHPGEIPEVAFDFAVDTGGQFHLLEINTKPGLAGIGSEVHVHDMRPEQRDQFESWVYPHTRHLARFLLRRSQRHDV